jgi:polygalacturonase
MLNSRMIRFHAAAAAVLLFAASASAQTPTVVTGDSRNVTEPVFPAVCMQLTAAIAQVNNDIPTSVDAVVTNPDAARIQAAINSCATNHPGQAVELSMDSTGTLSAFLSGPLVMPSNSALLVDPGVTLFFSRNAQDFDIVAGTHTCGTNNGNSANKSCKPPIDIPSNTTNVSIMGYGKLNARGGDPLLNGFATSGFTPPTVYTWWNLAALSKQQVPESMIQPESGVSNLTLYKITLQNSSMFHVKPIGNINGLTAWDVKIETPTFTNNTDGIDPDQAQNVTVTHSWISDGDDDIAIGSSGTPGGPNVAQNISIINNHFFAGHGESIGSFTDAGVYNILFDNNMLAGDNVSGKGSAINAVSLKVGSTTFPVNYADGNSTAVRIKSDQAAGGEVSNVQYSNSCFLDHNKDLLFTPLYNTDTGSNTPNVHNILLENLSFLNDATTPSSGTVQFTGTDTVVNGQTLIFPLQITLSNVSFPAALTASKFTNTGTAGKEQYAQLTYGPGDVSTNFINVCCRAGKQ